MGNSSLTIDQLNATALQIALPTAEGTPVVKLSEIDSADGLIQILLAGNLLSTLVAGNSTGTDPSGGKQLKIIYGQYAFPSTGSGATATATVNLTGGAVFSSATSYLVFVTSASYGFGAAAFLAASVVSGSQFEMSFWNGFTSSQPMTANWLAIGY